MEHDPVDFISVAMSKGCRTGHSTAYFRRYGIFVSERGAQHSDVRVFVASHRSFLFQAVYFAFRAGRLVYETV
jgi:hypothetical protein